MVPPIQEPLSWEKRALIQLFQRIFTAHVEAPNAICMLEIKAEYVEWYKRNKEWCKQNGLPKMASEQTLAKVIRHIRLNHTIPNLVANNRGYYVTNDPAELARYYHSLNHRAKAIVQVAEAMGEDYDSMTRRRAMSA